MVNGISFLVPVELLYWLTLRNIKVNSPKSAQSMPRNFLLNTIKEYFESCSLHGFYYIANEKLGLAKLLWTSVVLTFGLFAVSLIVSYLKANTLKPFQVLPSM